jgi:heptosyltransferase-1
MTLGGRLAHLPTMRILIVKTSSMGDVVHALPAVSDILAHVPGAEIDWLVEAPFAAIPQMHRGVRQVHVLRWRKWRKQLLQRSTWEAMGDLRAQLRAQPYDKVIDLQGLVKSVLWGRQALGPMVGYDRHSLREPLAACFYQAHAPVSRALHAVTRCRQLVAHHLGYAMPQSQPDFGLSAPPLVDWQAPASAYAVLIPGASRPEKFWPQDRWHAIAQQLSARGWTPVVLWGSPTEERMAHDIAAASGGAVPPFLTVAQAASVLAGAKMVVGLDTGFSHLAAALGRPTLGIYCDHEPGLAGITGSAWVRSIGGKGHVPGLASVSELVDEQMMQAELSKD